MVKTIISKLNNYFRNFKNNASGQGKKITGFIDSNPFLSFFLILGILLGLIIISNIIGNPKPAEKKMTVPAKKVKTYNIGKAPRLTVQAQIEKSGVVHIVALAPGVIQNINKQAGEFVNKGDVLLGLSSNYQGGNSFSLQRQLAQTQYQNVLETYDLQKNLIKKQHDAAEKSNVLSEDLRSITEQSLGDTRSLISLNEEILTALDQSLANLTATNIGGANDALILSTKQLKVQFLSANNQAKQALRQSEYNSASDNAPAKLSDLQENITLKQLDIQQKMLDLNREISRIQLQITQVNEALMYPTAPFSGTIQRIFVREGQQVNPGSELMILTGTEEKGTITAIAYISADISPKVSRLEPALLHLNQNKTYSVFPAFVTQEPIKGSLYGVYFSIPNEYAANVSEQGFITVELPVGYSDTAAVIPYIPVDAVYQTKELNYVYLVNKGEAQTKSIELGPVYGGYVEIIKGLKDGDKIILDRNVIAGDKVTTE